jgi:hypothetical protein
VAKGELDRAELTALAHHAAFFATNFAATFGMLSSVSGAVQALSPQKNR